MPETTPSQTNGITDAPVEARARTPSGDDGDDAPRIRVPKFTHGLLAAASNRTGRTIVDIANVAILSYFDRSEDIFGVESASVLSEMEALNTSNAAVSLATFALAEAMVEERAGETLRLASLCEVLAEKFAQLEALNAAK